MTTITIPKSIAKEENLIILSRKKYEEFLAISKKAGKAKIKSELDQGLDKSLKEITEGKTFGPFKTAETLIKSLEK